MLRLLAGVPEQAPDLGVGTVAAHWPGHGHREHPALCRLQQTEHNTGRESRVCLPLVRSHFSCLSSKLGCQGMRRYASVTLFRVPMFLRTIFRPFY